MNPYFSRLAQRSGVASMPASIKSANAGVDWNEQSVETTAPANALAPNAVSHASSTSIENRSMQAAERSVPTATMQSTSTSSKFVSTQQADKNAERLIPPANPSLISNTLSIGSDSVEHNRFQDASSLETSVSLTIPEESAEKTQTLASSVKHASTILNQPLANKSTSFKTNVEDSTRTGTVSSAQSETFEPSSEKVRSTASASQYSELHTQNTDKHDGQAPAFARPDIVLSKPKVERTERVEHVSSAPVHTPVLPLQAPRAASRSSIEVHIGKIELEIFSPTKKTAVAPAPVKAVTPRAASATAFNPHRHYLRGR